MPDLRRNGQTSNIFRFKLWETGLDHTSTGLIISTMVDVEASAVAYTVASSNIETITTLGTFATPTASKCRFKEVDSTNHPKLYEFQIADARFSVSQSQRVIITVTDGTNSVDYEVLLDPPAFVWGDPNDIIRSTFQSEKPLIPSMTIGDTGNDTAHLHVPDLTFGDDEINDYLIVVTDSSESEKHLRWVEDWVNSTKLMTVATLPFTPEDSTDSIEVFTVRRDVDAAKIGGSLTAAALLAMIHDAMETLTVDDANFTPTTTQAQFTASGDLEDEYLYQGLFGLTGANAGVTVWCSAYTYDGGNSQVRLTFDALEAAPADGDTFVKVGRRRST